MGAIWEALHLLTRYGAEDHVIKFAWPPKPPQVLKCLVRCASQPLAELCELLGRMSSFPIGSLVVVFGVVVLVSLCLWMTMEKDRELLENGIWQFRLMERTEIFRTIVLNIFGQP